MSANIRNDHAQHALKRTTHRLGLAIGGVTLIGFLMGWIGVLPLPQASIEWKMPRPEEESQYAPVGIGVAGEEVLMIYVGSSTCRWSNATELPGLVRKLKVDLQARVLESGYGFATLGISSDLSPVAGWRHLQAFGRFDEIVAGRGWLNTGLTRYVYGALPGQAATPQVILVQRRVTSERGNRAITHERVLLRRIGLDEIVDWVSAGAEVLLESPTGGTE